MNIFNCIQSIINAFDVNMCHRVKGENNPMPRYAWKIGTCIESAQCTSNACFKISATRCTNILHLVALSTVRVDCFSSPCEDKWVHGRVDMVNCSPIAPKEVSHNGLYTPQLRITGYNNIIIIIYLA